MSSARGPYWWHLLAHQEQSPARQALAPRGSAARPTAAAQGSQQKSLPAVRESQFPKPMRGLAHRCRCWVRRCSCHWAAKPPHPSRGTRHCKALTVPVPHGIVSKFREEDQPVSILQDFLIAIVRESESNLGCGVADPQEGALLVGAIPAEGAIGAEVPVAVVGLRASGSEKDREVGLGIKGGMRQPAFFECQSQQDSSPLRGVELECRRHFSPASGIQRSKDITHVLGAKTEGERGISCQ